jgi:DNA repair photolyase
MYMSPEYIPDDPGDAAPTGPYRPSRDAGNRRAATGRGAPTAPPIRFEHTRIVDDYEQLSEEDAEAAAIERRAPTVLLPDDAKTIIRENNSPDIAFRYSLNPYRGCEHGCAYCYARPGHETLGMNAGLDFETKILVKYNAAELLRQELSHPKWQCESIVMSGVTDCYQPIERTLRITRGCLEVMSACNQPCGIITKNALVARDIDLLASMAARHLVQVNISLTTLDAQLARTLEPRTASPAARLRAMRALSSAGVPVRVMTAPIIPGLNDDELPALLAAARDAGARAAGWTLLRLPWAVRPIFEAWLAEHAPLKKSRVEALIRGTRAGQMNDGKFGSRMRGQGAYAEQISQTFKVFTKKLGLVGPMPQLDTASFKPPTPSTGQLRLF